MYIEPKTKIAIVCLAIAAPFVAFALWSAFYYVWFGVETAGTRVFVASMIGFVFTAGSALAIYAPNT